MRVSSHCCTLSLIFTRAYTHSSPVCEKGCLWGKRGLIPSSLLPNIYVLKRAEFHASKRPEIITDSPMQKELYRQLRKSLSNVCQQGDARVEDARTCGNPIQMIIIRKLQNAEPSPPNEFLVRNLISWLGIVYELPNVYLPHPNIIQTREISKERGIESYYKLDLASGSPANRRRWCNLQWETQNLQQPATVLLPILSDVGNSRRRENAKSRSVGFASRCARWMLICVGNFRRLQKEKCVVAWLPPGGCLWIAAEDIRLRVQSSIHAFNSVAVFRGLFVFYHKCILIVMVVIKKCI